MFLTLVFLAELVAGVSGFIFRHEVSFSPPPKKIQIYSKNEPHQLIKIYNLLCFLIHQIKAKLGVAYKNAVKNYNSTDTSSIAVDAIQRTVSGRFSITLMVLLLSDFVCVALYKPKNAC